MKRYSRSIAAGCMAALYEWNRPPIITKFAIIAALIEEPPFGCRVACRDLNRGERVMPNFINEVIAAEPRTRQRNLDLAVFVALVASLAVVTLIVAGQFLV
jgi:hypothetical protein